MVSFAGIDMGPGVGARELIEIPTGGIPPLGILLEEHILSDSEFVSTI